jgi:Zn-dependent protease
MWLGEPPPSSADLHFQLFGIPVRVHPHFWLISLLLGMGGGQAEPISVLIWVGAVFVSILVHEMGHALVARRQGSYPAVTLYAFGGLASYQAVRHRAGQRIQVLAAGPAAGFVFALLTMLMLRLSGHAAGLVPLGETPDLAGGDARSFYQLSLVAFDVYFTPLDSSRLNQLVADLLVINILWGMINLLPLYPLDGGQIAREVLMEANPAGGMVQSLWLSVLTGVGLAAYAISENSLWMTLFFGYLAFQSYRMIDASWGPGSGGRW